MTIYFVEFLTVEGMPFKNRRLWMSHRERSDAEAQRRSYAATAELLRVVSAEVSDAELAEEGK